MASESLQVRRRPTRAGLGEPRRDSNVIRASVLETALELGFSQNSTVANWIFNNPLSEEAEPPHPEPDDQTVLGAKSESPSYIAEATTPTLTSGSNSTSDESSSLNSPGNSAPNPAITTIQVHPHKPSVTESPHVHFGDFSSDQLQLFSPFALSPHEAHHLGTGGDSLGSLPRDPGRSRSQDDSLRHTHGHESPSPGPAEAGYTSEGQYLSKAKVNKDKAKPAKSRNSKGSNPKTPETSKTGEKDGDYASDGGYLSASSNKSQGKSPGKVKSRAMAFFRRRTKKSTRASDDEDEDSVPPVPAIPTLPRPSSPKPLERRAAPSSPTRPGFTPLILNLTSPPASPPPRRRVSKSPPPPRARATPPQQSEYSSVPQRPASPLIASASSLAILTPAAAAATCPLPPSMPGTPVSTASFATVSSSSTQLAAGSLRSLTTQSSRQHLSIPPPAPPPTLPLPQPPPSSSAPPGMMLPPLPTTPTTPSRKSVPTRSLPVTPMTPGSMRPLSPRRTASPFRPLLPPRAIPPTVSQARAGESLDALEGNRVNGQEATGKLRSATAGLGSTPAFLQRKIQHGPPPSPRYPPPDVPLPPSPCPMPITRPRTPIGASSKFREHFSSVSSVPSSQLLSTPASMSPSLTTVTLSESSSGPSIRSSHISSVSGLSEELSNTPEYSRPTTSTSSFSEVSYGQPISSTFGRHTLDFKSHFLARSDVSSGALSSTMRRGNGSLATFDDGDDGDIDDTASKSFVEEDDDASVYPSDDQTAGRRTMYLVEHGGLDENGDEVVINGSYYWGGHDAPPPLPPLPPMPTRPGPGYF